MKYGLIFASLLAIAFAFGCKRSGEKTADQTTSQQLEKVQSATKEAAEQMQDYSFEKKEEFIAAMHNQLDALNKGMDELSVKIGKSSEAVQAEAKPKLAVLHEQAIQLNKQLGEVANATASTWSVIKADAEKGYASLKDGLAQSRQAVADKIAP
jgi:adenine-specific DNA methylase